MSHQAADESACSHRALLLTHISCPLSPSSDAEEHSGMKHNTISSPAILTLGSNFDLWLSFLAFDPLTYLLDLNPLTYLLDLNCLFNDSFARLSKPNRVYTLTNQWLHCRFRKGPVCPLCPMCMLCPMCLQCPVFLLRPMSVLSCVWALYCMA